MSKNGPAPVTPFINFPGIDGVEIGVLEEEGEDGNHALETIGYVAISDDYTGRFGLLDVETGMIESSDELTTDSFAMPFDSRPAFFSMRQTLNGSDPAYARTQNLTNDRFGVLMQEEASSDPEFDHGAETVGYLAIDEGDLGLYVANEIFFADGTVFYPEDDDADPTNEFNTGAQLNGSRLEIEDAGGVLSVDLSTVVKRNSLDASDGDPVDALFVDAEGNAGIGTTTPQAGLHVSTAIKGPFQSSVLAEIFDNDGEYSRLNFVRSVFVSGDTAYIASIGED